MAWLDSLFSREKRHMAIARALYADGKFDAALDKLRLLASPQATELREEVQGAAAVYHLDKAMEDSEAGHGKRLSKRMARARRYYRPDLEPLYREAGRTMRIRRLRMLIPEHWVEILDASIAQRQAHFLTPTSLGVPRFRVFMSRKLLAFAGETWAEDPNAPPADTEAIERADDAQLQMLIPALRTMYPDDLADSLEVLGGEFARAVLHIGNGRPDLATLPLLELPENDALVCFERARVAHILGFPRTALIALQGFRTLVGGHRTIRRLNTGVFAAQMAVSIGDEARALRVIRAVPVRFLGRRPLALYARLLINAGELEVALQVLEDHLSRVSDNDDAILLLDEVRARIDSRDGWDRPEVTAEVLIGSGPMLDEGEAAD